MHGAPGTDHHDTIDRAFRRQRLRHGPECVRGHQPPCADIRQFARHRPRRIERAELRHHGPGAQQRKQRQRLRGRVTGQQSHDLVRPHPRPGQPSRATGHAGAKLRIGDRFAVKADRIPATMRGDGAVQQLR